MAVTDYQVLKNPGPDGLNQAVAAAIDDGWQPVGSVAVLGEYLCQTMIKGSLVLVGATGAKGDTGDTGAAGAAGSNGTNGTNGASGLTLTPAAPAGDFTAATTPHAYLVANTHIPTLPAASAAAGVMHLFRVGAAGANLTSTGGDTINGAASPYAIAANATVLVVSDGTSNWFIK